MHAGLHAAEDGREPDEVRVLGGSQRMFFEERDDDLQQIAPTLHREAEERFVMVVVTTVLDHRSAAELLEEEIDGRPGGCGLGHRELVLDLPAESATRVSNHRDREAAFTVDEADDPLLDTWPFLLIVRTGWIFTAHTPPSHEGVTRMDEYHRILGYSSIWPAALHTSPREGATPSHVRVSITLGPL